MNSILLITNDATEQEVYLETFLAQQKITPFDVTTLEEEGSIGIELVRKMQEQLFFKPRQGSAKAVIIKNAQRLTTEAQNALLKILEEPPAYAYLLLLATTKDAFLPTVLSRCQVIHLASKQHLLTEEEIQTCTQQLAIMQNGSIGEKLVLAEALAGEKENLASWFEAITRIARDRMKQEKDPQTFAKLLFALHHAYKTISTTNVSARTVLEHTFLTL